MGHYSEIYAEIYQIGLNYLFLQFLETLRKFPGAGRLERVCVRDYKDEETGLVIPKDALIDIPVNAIHHDKKYYEKPGEFYPEHFSPEKKAARNPYAFMPFGIGPRNCIVKYPFCTKFYSLVHYLIHISCIFNLI